MIVKEFTLKEKILSRLTDSIRCKCGNIPDYNISGKLYCEECANKMRNKKIEELTN
jgi:hypothetical protein